MFERDTCLSQRYKLWQDKETFPSDWQTATHLCVQHVSSEKQLESHGEQNQEERV